MNNSSNHFSDAALRFLRGLRKNNDRTWFNEHKPLYMAQVYEPMLSLCDAISEAMREFAPYHVKPGRKAIMRIYENLRFHQDKLPYKNHLGAWWGRIGMEKTSGAGYYFHISSTEVLLGADVSSVARAVGGYKSGNRSKSRSFSKGPRLKAITNLNANSRWRSNAGRS